MILIQTFFICVYQVLELTDTKSSDNRNLLYNLMKRKDIHCIIVISNQEKCLIFTYLLIFSFFQKFVYSSLNSILVHSRNGKAFSLHTPHGTIHPHNLMYIIDGFVQYLIR